MGDFDSFLVTLIQRTPHIDSLIQLLDRRGFPTAQTNRIVTQYLKARRLYDALFQECFNYKESERDRLKKVFHDSGNGYAGDLLFSYRNPIGMDSIEFWKTTIESLAGDPKQSILHQSNQSTIRISSASVLQIFGAAKVGNVTKMESLMRGMAAKCVIIHLPPWAFKRGAAGLQNLIKEKLAIFRASLRSAFLKNRDWNDKTLLHVAIDAQTLECVQLVLKYAQEAGVKGDMLDSKDAFGNTPLLLSLRRKNARMSKKLILEGADIFLMNNKNQFPLQMIYQRFPKMGLYLMDKAVTVSGDASSDSFFLNIDFGVISTFIEFQEDEEENRLVRLTGFKASDRRRRYRDAPYYAHIIQMKYLNEDQLDSQASQKHDSPALSTSTDSSTITSYKKELHRKEEEMSIMASLVYNDIRSCSQILSHPVARLFLNLKWDRLKWVVYGNTALRILFYLMFFSLTFRIYFVDCPHRISSKNVTIEGELEFTDYPDCSWSYLTLLLLPIVTAVNVIYICTEMLKIPLILRVSRFKTYWFGYLGMGAWIRMLFFLVAMLTSTVPFYQNRLHSYQYLVAVAGVLLGSILLLQVLGDSNLEFLVHSIYVHVYARVLTRFLTVITTFSSIILGFAISFSIVFPQPKEFSTFARSYFRLLIMIHGEFDFEDKSLDSEGDAWVFWAGQLLYVLFACGVTLVLIDVFLGYTVSDIKELTEQAEDVRRYIQIQQMFVMEIFQVSIKRGLEKLFGIKVTYFQHSIIPGYRLRKHRKDVMVGFEELPESMQTEFKDLLCSNN